LVGPAGIWTLHPKTQKGTITYHKNRWRQKGGGLLQGYLRLFAQEGIGRPDLEIDSDVNALSKYLDRSFTDLDLPPIQSALVFFHPEVVIEAEDAPAPTLFSKKLKDFIRKTAKEESTSMDVIEEIQNGVENFR
jgi:hypothetical protein